MLTDATQQAEVTPFARDPSGLPPRCLLAGLHAGVAQSPNEPNESNEPHRPRISRQRRIRRGTRIFSRETRGDGRGDPSRDHRWTHAGRCAVGRAERRRASSGVRRSFAGAGARGDDGGYDLRRGLAHKSARDRACGDEARRAGKGGNRRAGQPLPAGICRRKKGRGDCAASAHAHLRHEARHPARGLGGLRCRHRAGVR